MLLDRTTFLVQHLALLLGRCGRNTVAVVHIAVLVDPPIELGLHGGRDPRQQHNQHRRPRDSSHCNFLW